MKSRMSFWEDTRTGEINPIFILDEEKPKENDESIWRKLRKVFHVCEFNKQSLKAYGKWKCRICGFDNLGII